jgi:hypothetical protein
VRQRVLGLLIEQSDSKSLVRRAADSVQRADGALAMMGLWSRPQTRSIVARRGNPLQIGDVARTASTLATLAQNVCPGKASAT